MEQALADFFEHSGRAEQVVAHAAAKAARVIAEGEREAREPRDQAAAAIARLDALGETRTSIVELTGLAPAAIRDAVIAGRQMAGGGRAGPG